MELFQAAQLFLIEPKAEQQRHRFASADRHSAVAQKMRMLLQRRLGILEPGVRVAFGSPALWPRATATLSNLHNC